MSEIETRRDTRDDWLPRDDESVAYYVRRSTFEQENEHQITSVRRFLERNDLKIGDAEDYTETASGARRNRAELRRLMEDIENGEVDHVVVWELSRIARDGLLSQEFFTLCEDHGVVIHVTDGNVEKITPDGKNRLIAGVLAEIYADERRTLIRRTKLGQERALRNNKWVGKPPLGFTTDIDGFLITNVEVYETYNPDRDGFYTIAEAIRQLNRDDDASFRGLAMDMECSRTALSNVYKDEPNRRRYLEREAGDERVQQALDELGRLEE